jgi:hypothetical protein
MPAKRRVVACLAVALVTAACCATMASAAEPIITVVEVDSTSTSASLTQRCGFQVDVHSVGTIRSIVFLDETGTPSQIILTAQGQLTDTYTNSNTGATSVVFHPFSDHFTREPDGTWLGVYTGVRQLVVAPGEGVDRVWTGRWEFTARIPIDPNTGLPVTNSFGLPTIIPTSSTTADHTGADILNVSSICESLSR